MRAVALAAGIVLAMTSVALAQTSVISSAAVSGGCKVTSSTRSSGSVSSGVSATATATATGGTVSTTTKLGSDDLSITVRSKDGKTNASVSAPFGSRVVITSTSAGDCEVTVENK